jgi:hypothetical protein
MKKGGDREIPHWRRVSIAAAACSDTVIGIARIYQKVIEYPI